MRDFSLRLVDGFVETVSAFLDAVMKMVLLG